MERPKRRRYKDNPYTLEVIGNKHYIKFKDSANKIQVIEVSIDIYNVFDASELHDLKEMNEFDNHIEHSEIFENNINSRLKDKQPSIEDEIIKKSTIEDLKKALDMLPEVQKRRIIKYYFEDKTEQEIADEENSTQQAVHTILERAKENLKKILKN